WHRAPHVWLGRDGRHCSTIDLFGPGFALLAPSSPEGEAWLRAARAAAERLNVGVDAHAIGAPGGWTDLGGSFARRYGAAPTGAVLVRPDGHVAFRAQRPTADPASELSSALARILGRSDC